MRGYMPGAQTVPCVLQESLHHVVYKGTPAFLEVSMRALNLNPLDVLHSKARGSVTFVVGVLAGPT